MQIYLAKRIAWAVPVLVALSLITFTLIHAVPGGPFDTDKPVPIQVKQNLEVKFRLDQPFWRQYSEYGWGLVTRLDFGPSYVSTSRDARSIVADHLPVSAQLTAYALLIAIGLGLPLGVLAAYHHNTPIDYAASTLAVVGLAVPSIVLAPILIWVFALKLHVLPVATWGGPSHAVLPSFTLGLAMTAFVARLVRASLLDVLQEDYIRSARARGLSEMRVVVVHGLRNALIPVISYMGPLVAFLIAGAIVVERIFAVPGMGSQMVTAIGQRDYPVIMAITLVTGAITIGANIAVEILHGVLDPRVRYR